MRGATRARDETLHSPLGHGFDPFDQQIRGAMRRESARLIENAKILELAAGMLHHLPVTRAAHYDSDQGLFHHRLTATLQMRYFSVSHAASVHRCDARSGKSAPQRVVQPLRC